MCANDSVKDRKETHGSTSWRGKTETAKTKVAQLAANWSGGKGWDFIEGKALGRDPGQR